jgi:quercetin dioxygenase-like cupin family protein
MSKIVVVREESVPPFSKGGRDFRVLLSPSKQNTKIAMGTADVYPGQSTPLHTHDTEEEAWYVLSGHGVVVLDDEIVTVAPGVVVVAPPGVPHQLVNGSEVSHFKCLVIFSPAGPEEAFIP